MNFENYLAIGIAGISLILAILFLNKNTIKSIWDYFFNKWEITIDSRGKETWHQNYDQNNTFNLVNHRFGKIPNSEYERFFIIYRYKNKYNKEEKLVKEYLE